MSTQFPVVTISGSMRYYPKMLEIASQKTLEGWIVLMPFSVEEEATPNKRMLDEMHFAKIRMSDQVVVIGVHVGESTRNEIDYAYAHGVEVIFHNKLGRASYDSVKRHPSNIRPTTPTD